VQNLFYFLLFCFLCSCSSGNNVDKDQTKDSVVVDSMVWFENNVKLAPKNLPLLFERAKFYLRRTMVEEAQADLETYMKLDSSNLVVHKLYGDIMMSGLNLERSKFHYEYILDRDTLNIDPYQTEPYFMKGMIYRSDYLRYGREESWDLALTSFQTAIEQDPNNYSAYVQLGVMYDQIGDSTAVDYYNSALEIYPESMEAWYNKGMFYQNRGRIDEAFNCYRSIHKIDSTWTEPYYNEGYIHLLVTEEFDSAVYYFEKAVLYDPGYYQAYNNLGLAYEKKGDFSNARFYYTKAIEINPDFKLAKDNLNRLQ
jgi:tetratricopeptide (TPR) repeat protein